MAHGPKFEGEPGPGANIDLNLPLPGGHKGRRYLKIEDIPGDRFRTDARSLGIRYSTLLGLSQNDQNGWQIDEAARLVDTWGRWREATLRPLDSRPALRNAQAALVLDASKFKVDRESLQDWVRDGPIFQPTAAPVARLQSDGDDVVDPRQDVERQMAEHEQAFQNSLTRLEEGIVALPTTKWGGAPTDVVINVNEVSQPALFIVQVFGISSFLGRLGAGKTIKTIPMHPGETMTIFTRTWRATESSRAEASTIIDSYGEKSSERFAETVLDETTDAATRSKSENWHAEAEVNASWGWGSARVSGGGGEEYSSTTEEFSKALNESVSEHVAESSASRESTVTSSSESSESTEDEEVVERTIQNINVRRVLTHAIRELTQEYDLKVHLRDLRIAFSNGNSGSWREVPLSGMRSLLEEVIKAAHVDEVAGNILRTIAVVFDKDDAPVNVLEQVTLNRCGTNWLATAAEPDADCNYPPPTSESRIMFYRFKRGPLGRQSPDEQPVDGVVVRQQKTVLATDSLIVEPVLSASDALDEYAKDLQIEAIREKRLANEREALAQRIVAEGDATAAKLFAELFPPAADDDQGEGQDAT